jgi:hypothetical protein
MVALENITTAAMTLTAALLAAIALRAWIHTRSQKVLLLGAAFVLFFIKGLMLSIGLFTSASWGDSLLGPSVVFYLGILLLFYLSVLKRSPA